MEMPYRPPEPAEAGGSCRPERPEAWGRELFPALSRLWRAVQIWLISGNQVLGTGRKPLQQG